MGILPGEAPFKHICKNSQANKGRLLEQFMLQNIQGKNERNKSFKYSQT